MEEIREKDAAGFICGPFDRRGGQPQSQRSVVESGDFFPGGGGLDRDLENNAILVFTQIEQRDIGHDVSSPP
jgi:hypothetical protein